MPLLCKALNNDNHNIFMKIANPNIFSIFKIEDEHNSYADNNTFAHITDNLYVRQFMSSSDILDKMYKVASAFDYKGGTDYANDILFTLK